MIACQPIDFDGAVRCLDDYLPEELRATLLAQDGGTKEHFGIGLTIRNFWLRGHPALLKYFSDIGFRMLDDVSSAILDGYVAKQTGQPFSIKAAGQRSFDYVARSKQRRRLPTAECREGTSESRADDRRIRSCSIDGNGMKYVYDPADRKRHAD